MTCMEGNKNNPPAATRGLPPIDFVTETVALGSYQQMLEAGTQLQPHGFRSLLNVAGMDCRSDLAACGFLDVRHIPLYDYASFAAGVEALQQLARELAPVFVHCHLGISRSASIVAGWLVRERGMTPDEAAELVQGKRKGAGVSVDYRGFLDQLYEEAVAARQWESSLPPVPEDQ